MKNILITGFIVLSSFGISSNNLNQEETSLISPLPYYDFNRSQCFGLSISEFDYLIHSEVSIEAAYNASFELLVDCLVN